MISPSVFLNGRRLHGIRDGAYYWMELPAGQYDFAIRRPIGPVYLTHIFKTKLKVEGGRSYYFRYDEENFRPQPDASLNLFKEKYLTAFVKIIIAAKLFVKQIRYSEEADLGTCS